MYTSNCVLSSIVFTNAVDATLATIYNAPFTATPRAPHALSTPVVTGDRATRIGRGAYDDSWPSMGAAAISGVGVTVTAAVEDSSGNLAGGDDLTELAAACQQLIADVEGDVTEAVVQRYYGGRVETSSFVVADTAIAGRYGEALIALRHALASGADPVPMVAAFAMKLRTMARVIGVREGSASLAARLGMKDWQVDRARRDLVGWTEAQLGLAIQAAARADAEVKGASRDPVFALERLVTVVATRSPFGS